GEDLAAPLLYACGQSPADLVVVHDAGLGDVNRPQPRRVWLQLGQTAWVDHLAPDAVGLPAFVDGLESRQFRLAHGDNDLAADLVGNPLGRAEFFHRALAGAAVDGLERPGLVINSGVENPRIVAGLMAGQLRLLLQDHDRSAGKLLGELV